MFFTKLDIVSGNTLMFEAKCGTLKESTKEQNKNKNKNKEKRAETERPYIFPHYEIINI